MNKSFIERIFPHSSNSILPQYVYTSNPPSEIGSPPRINLRDTSSNTSSPPNSARKSLESVPLRTSVAHHDDPFLPVERAARSLQRTIQAYLDAQSDGLNESLSGGDTDDLSSVGSPTPTPSDVLSSRSNAGIKTVPIRQPVTKKVTLRGARKGLARSMDDFAQLKEEELRIIRAESNTRRNAVKQSKNFLVKKAALESQIRSIKQDDSSSDVASIRSEATKIEIEIRELEDRLFEMKARHRHLIDKATQLENSIDSKLSSYKNSLAMIEKDVKNFLQRPPVTHSLTDFDTSGATAGGIYALKPERRTLQMAEEQWITEQDLLSKREEGVENERRALHDGAKMWRAAMKRINEFEKHLRRSLSQSRSIAANQTKRPDEMVSPTIAADPPESMLPNLSELITSLEEDLHTAESQNWNLLICCLGAEIEALQQARALLQDASGNSEYHDSKSKNMLDGDEVDAPPEDLLRQQSNLSGSVVRSPSAGSNHSLEDTLREFGNGAKGKRPVRSTNTSSEDVRNTQTASIDPRLVSKKSMDMRSESEDDDPGPDFLLSHS